MDKNILKKLLDVSFELEGLVTLALDRGDHYDPSLDQLILRKGDTIASICRQYSDSWAGKNYLGGLPSCIEDTLNKSDSDTEDSFTGKSSFIDDPGEYVLDDSSEESFDIMDEENDDLVSYQDDEAEILAEDLQIEPRGHLVFSINDKFRFKRKLFNDSDVDFNNSLAIIASMDNYDEAEEYFMSDLQMDPMSADVISFLNIVKKYFGE